MKRNVFLLGVIGLFFMSSITGCAVIFQKGRRSDIRKIATLNNELEQLKRTQSVLEGRLSNEIKDKQVRLKMADKGLVITFVAEVLFDSGKSKLKKESMPILDKVAGVIREEVPDNNVGIEGYTDNQPIKYSRWKSNWELSSHRALSVLHYLESKGVNPEMLSAIGYGQYHPVVSNDTPAGRRKNRRVEVVILPKTVKKIESGIREKISGEAPVKDEELK